MIALFKKEFLEMLEYFECTNWNLKILYWTSTKHLDSEETNKMKNFVLNSNNLQVYKDK